MQCYCSQITFNMLMFWNIIGLNFREYDVNGEDKTNYCALWYLQNFISQLINYSAIIIVVVLNAVIADLFQKVTTFL